MMRLERRESILVNLYTVFLSAIPSNYNLFFTLKIWLLSASLRPSILALILLAKSTKKLLIFDSITPSLFFN